jgi:hypothetical protein
VAFLWSASRIVAPFVDQGASIEESWVREWELSEACLFVPKGSFHLLLLIAIVLATTQRDLVVVTGRGPCPVRGIRSL